MATGYNRGGRPVYGGAVPYRSQDGLSTRPVGGVGSDEIQLRIDPVHGELDEEITGLRKQVRQLRNGYGVVLVNTDEAGTLLAPIVVLVLNMIKKLLRSHLGTFTDVFYNFDFPAEALFWVAQEIESEAKFQNDLLSQLQMTLIKAQAGVKNNVRRLNKSIVQYGSSNVVHVVAFALVCFFIVYMWSKMSRR